MAATVKAICIHQTGGPEVLSWEDVAIGEPGPGEVRLRHTAVGLNFIDINHRTGAYRLDSLPAVIGMEGAGVVEQVGEAVEGLASGDRVSYCMVLGSYAHARIIAADRLIKLEDHTSDDTAAAVTLRGLTAHYLLKELYPVQPGDVVLVQAAAGGVGLLLCQWAKHLGATVLGTVGTEAKAALAKAHGCDHPILYGEVDFAEAVMELTDGHGVTVIYDAVGKETYEKGLGVIAERGWMVPAYTMPPNADHVKVMRVLVKETLSHALAERGFLAKGIRACGASRSAKGVSEKPMDLAKII